MGRKKTLETPEQKPKSEEDEFFEGEHYEEPQPQSPQDERNEERLKEKRRWLRSLTQADRDFIAKYGEDSWYANLPKEDQEFIVKYGKETWKTWKNRSWKNDGTTRKEENPKS